MKISATENPSGFLQPFVGGGRGRDEQSDAVFKLCCSPVSGGRSFIYYMSYLTGLCAGHGHFALGTVYFMTAS